MPPAEDLFLSILRAPDRDHSPGARPVVSFREDDPPAFLRQLRRYALARYELVRRGAWHGRWAELDGERLGLRAPGGRRLRTALQRRWHLAQPIVRRGQLAADAELLQSAAAERMETYRALSQGGSLARWLESRLEGDESFAVAPEAPPAGDPERDLEKAVMTSYEAPGSRLWAKSGRLSTDPGDASLRLRFGFGEEGADDASPDAAEHRRLAELATRVLPEAAVVAECSELRSLLDRLCAREVFFTAPIVYWNAPGGGALFHHDAFDEDPEHRQLGVVYVQLGGRTAWLALSLEDLAERVRELVTLVDEGAVPWLPDELGLPWHEVRELARERRALVSELVQPGCGRLAGLVNRGPEFTSLLADAGHGSILRPGDALLLPNHGLSCTAMHSVFCASPQVTLGLSVALRA